MPGAHVQLILRPGPNNSVSALRSFANTGIYPTPNRDFCLLTLNEMAGDHPAYAARAHGQLVTENKLAQPLACGLTCSGSIYKGKEFMKLTGLITAGFLALSALPATAVPVEVKLTFTDGALTLFGLDNGTTAEQSATSWLLEGVRRDYDVLDFQRPFNSITFASNGTLDSLLFGTAPTVTMGFGNDTLYFLQCNSDTIPDGSDTCSVVEGQSGQSLSSLGSLGSDFQTSGGLYAATITPVSAVPLPAGGMLGVTGVLALAGLGWRQRRAQ